MEASSNINTKEKYYESNSICNNDSSDGIAGFCAPLPAFSQMKDMSIKDDKKPAKRMMKKLGSSRTGERAMKAIYSVTLMTAALFLLAFSMPAQASKIDSRIESFARQSYVFKTYLQSDDIKIKSSDGAVTLTGIVSENFHKSLAQETIAGLPGVRRVDNRLAIKGAAPTTNSDAWLRDKVKVALLFHRSVSSTKTEVDVKDGIITLRGNATTQAQKELTAEYAKDIDGVRGVKNEIAVAEASTKLPRTIGEKVDDASITAQVKMTLLNHRSTNVLNTTVKTKHGVVTVGGKAESLAAKYQVTKLVTDINGVKSVTNRMTIE